MASTFVSLNYHIVFSTKDRKYQIVDSWASRLHEYLGGTIKGLDGVSLQVGGIEDHVHLLVGLKATHCLSDVMRELKRASSLWVHSEIGEKRFAWQEGYAALSVSAPPLARVCGRHQEAERASPTIELSGRTCGTAEPCGNQI